MPNFEQLKRVWRGIDLRRKIVILSVGGGVVVAIGTLVLWANRPDMVPLYSGLSPQDMSAVEESLRKSGILYKLSPENASILIPSKEVYKVRMQLATEELPQGKSMVGFEIFDETKFGMTEFVQNVRYQRALQGELARSIMEMDSIEGARIHLSIPQSSLFTDEQKPPKASIILKLRRGGRLSPKQIDGIVHLVSNAVEGLHPEDVTVVDTASQTLYSGGGSESLAGRVPRDQLDYKHAVEAEYERQIREMLEKVVGFGKVAVQVSADIDFASEQQTVEKYDSDPVIRTEDRTEETTSGAPNLIPAGVPGVASNIVSPFTSASGGVPFTYTKETTTTSYNQGKTVMTRVKAPGEIKRISAAVMVDNTANLPIAQLNNLVQSAIGYDETRGDKVEVQAVSFSNAALEKEIAEEQALLKAINTRRLLQSIMKFGGLALLLVCLYLFLLRPVLNTFLAKSHPGPQPILPAADWATEGVRALDEAKGEGEVKGLIRPKRPIDEELQIAKAGLMKAAEEDPKKIVAVITNWIEEEKVPDMSQEIETDDM